MTLVSKLNLNNSGSCGNTKPITAKKVGAYHDDPPEFANASVTNAK